MTQQEFETAARELRQQMYDVGLRYFHSQEDAEDVAQESLLLLWKYCEKVNVSMNVKALAVRVAKNYCISMKRKKTFNPAIDNNGNGIDSSIPSSDYNRLEAEEYDKLLEGIMQKILSPRERELFELRRLDGLSNEEIETRTGIKKATIQSMVSKARKKLFFEIRKKIYQ